MPAADVLITAAWVWRSMPGTARVYETVPYGGAWPNWKRMGMTSAPLTVNFERTRLDKMVQQSLGKIGSVITGESLTITTTLAEMTMDNLAVSWPGEVTKVAAAAGQTPYERLRGGGKVLLQTMQWGFEGLYQLDEVTKLPLRFFCIGEAEMGGQIDMNKEAQTGIPLTISGSHDLDLPPGVQLYEWFKVTGISL